MATALDPRYKLLLNLGQTEFAKVLKDMVEDPSSSSESDSPRHEITYESEPLQKKKRSDSVI